MWGDLYGAECARVSIELGSTVTESPTLLAGDERWSEIHLPVFGETVAKGKLRLEGVAWVPGAGERSLGVQQIPVADVCERRSVSIDGVIQVQVDWHPEADPVWHVSHSLDSQYRQEAARHERRVDSPTARLPRRFMCVPSPSDPMETSMESWDRTYLELKTQFEDSTNELLWNLLPCTYAPPRLA